jgi:hypothetical protein
MPTSRTKRPALATTSPTTREPVPDGEHPLSVASPIILGEDLSHTAPSPIEAPVATTDEASFLEDDPDDEGGSDRDAAFIDGEVSSVDEGSVYAPPDLADFVLLDHLSCRAPTQVTAKRGGPKETGVCGQTVPLRQRHLDYRTKGHDFYAKGHYHRMHSYHGFQFLSTSRSQGKGYRQASRCSLC